MDENYTRILKELRNKIYKNIYFLFGDEPYYIDLISDYISKNVLEESERAFNQVTIYGEETDTPAIINTSRRFPMMSNYQVVIIKEAQYLKDLDQLKSYVEAPLSSTILVICYKYKNLDKRTSLYKSLDRSVNAELFHSKKLRDYQVPGWIDNYFREKNITADRNVSMILTEYLGADLSKIVNELNKLFISLPEDQKRESLTQ